MSDTDTSQIALDEGQKMYQEHLLEQYKLYVDQSQKFWMHRTTVNSFYISIITLIFGFIALNKVSNVYQIGLCIFVILLCGIWYNHHLAYTQTNRARFSVIDHLEARLPQPLNQLEWQVMQDEKRFDSSLKKIVDNPSTQKNPAFSIGTIERSIPMIIGAFFFIVIGYLVWFEIPADRSAVETQHEIHVHMGSDNG